MNQLQTPHSGYHWRGSSSRFFEGWYYRVTLPEDGQSFAFMYSIEDPSGNKPCSGGAAQVLGPNDEYLCRTFPDVKRFWASCDRLALVHWSYPKIPAVPQIIPPNEFFESVSQGYQATATYNQGAIADPSSGNSCRWEYAVEPVYGWGNYGEPPQATAGWSSFLSIFEPGWQVLMASGKATGWIEWNGKRYDFIDAPAYAEKNWGGSFPKKWFWINSNSFENEPDLALTAVGAYRKVLWSMECVGMIGLHYQGQFYEFSSLKSQLEWRVAPWGNWQMQAINDSYKLNLSGISDYPGNYVRVPTKQGLVFSCRDTTHGSLKLEMRDRLGDRVLLNAESHLAGLEVGGEPWEETWEYPL
ncbi:tocopherol cyclase family protein [Merismopedia glauca]|uniref:Tocopherol cyclase n=1 Tax=Merismopedia glauca CCAP 1448/3 TaxID=1296344 RepID=A0A2T1C097_9CYAN|nr:tocopherol cyclase family protein [Merismopedia glauca]PSB01681.1 tocopherol cyclase [Merismopedia glauca CCAP 1448/3]